MLSSYVRGRFGYAVWTGLKTVATSFARTLYVLWLQSTGLIFGAFTALGAWNMVRLFRQHAWSSDRPRFWTTLGFTLVCAGFTFVSFWKAKRRQTSNRASR